MKTILYVTNFAVTISPLAFLATLNALNREGEHIIRTILDRFGLRNVGTRFNVEERLVLEKTVQGRFRRQLREIHNMLSSKFEFVFMHVQTHLNST